VASGCYSRRRPLPSAAATAQRDAPAVAAPPRLFRPRICRTPIVRFCYAPMDGRAHRGMCGRLVRVFAIDLVQSLSALGALEVVERCRHDGVVRSDR
jgi:hypothetical protein